MKIIVRFHKKIVLCVMQVPCKSTLEETLKAKKKKLKALTIDKDRVSKWIVF